MKKLDKKRARKPQTWKELGPEQQKELVFQYLVFYYGWTIIDSSIPRKKIRKVDKAATARVKAPLKLRKEASKQALAYFLEYLEEHEREAFPGYKEWKKKQQRKQK